MIWVGMPVTVCYLWRRVLASISLACCFTSIPRHQHFHQCQDFKNPPWSWNQKSNINQNEITQQSNWTESPGLAYGVCSNFGLLGIRNTCLRMRATIGPPNNNHNQTILVTYSELIQLFIDPPATNPCKRKLTRQEEETKVTPKINWLNDNKHRIKLLTKSSSPTPNVLCCLAIDTDKERIE